MRSERKWGESQDIGLNAVLLFSYLWNMGLPSVPAVEVQRRLQENTTTTQSVEENDSQVELWLQKVAAQFTTHSEKETQQVARNELQAYGYDGSYLSTPMNIRVMQLAGLVNPTVNARDFLFFNLQKNMTLMQKTFAPPDFIQKADAASPDTVKHLALTPGDFVYMDMPRGDVSVMVTKVDAEHVYGLTTLPSDHGYVIQEQPLVDNDLTSRGLVSRLDPQTKISIWGLTPEAYERFADKTIPSLMTESPIDIKAYALAAQATPDSLPTFSKDWYKAVVNNGYIPDKKMRLLNETYYPPSPQRFMGWATRYSVWQRMITNLWDMGKEIRAQMKRGWVLRASGEYGYHDELQQALAQWIPHSLYGRDLNPQDVLLDNQSAPLYAYLAEQHLGGPYHSPLPVPYSSLNTGQKLLFDLTSQDSAYLNSRFVSIATQQIMGPEKALESGTYVSALATKSPNDFGRRFLLFQRNDQGELIFYGVTVVGDVLSRADWTGTGSVLDPANNGNPIMLKSQLDQRGTYEQWGFDLPDPLYYAMGGKDGPVFGVIAVDAALLEK